MQEEASARSCMDSDRAYQHELPTDRSPHARGGAHFLYRQSTAPEQIRSSGRDSRVCQTEGDAASPPKAKGRGTKHRSKSRMDGGESEQNWAAAGFVAAEVLVAAT